MACVEDHEILDEVFPIVSANSDRKASRESECIEFVDDGQWYELVVRSIDGPSRETEPDNEKARG